MNGNRKKKVKEIGSKKSVHFVAAKFLGLSNKIDTSLTTYY